MKERKDFKVLLINLSLRPKSPVHLLPVGLGYIATAIYNAGFVLKILDNDALRLSEDEVEEFIKETDFDAVAMGCIVTGYKYVKKLIERIKEFKQSPIIVGNSVASSIPTTLMHNTKADIGVLGEGDITIIEVLDALRMNKPLEDVKGIFFKEKERIVFTTPRDLISNLDNLPFINYDLFDIEFYIERTKINISEPYPIKSEKIRAIPVNSARGCPFNCAFCYHVFKGLKYRFRSVENIIKEIKFLKKRYGINYIMFWDELCLFSKKRANEIADAFIKEKLNVFWIGDCRAGLFNEKDLNLALKLKKSGCVDLSFSLESADGKILKAMNKHITVEDFITQAKILHEAGISTSTSLVLGYPEETLDTIQKTFDVCNECEIYPSTGYLLPQPGTPIYDYSIKIGKIKNEEDYLLRIGDRQDFHINLTKLKQEDIENLVKENLKKISDKLKLGLHKDNLIKTLRYRQKSINK